MRSGPARRCCCCRPATAEGLRELRSGLASELSGPDRAGPVRRRFHSRGPAHRQGCGLAAVVHDQEHAARVLEAGEHDNVFDGESVDGPDRIPGVVFLFPGPRRPARRNGPRVVRIRAGVRRAIRPLRRRFRLTSSESTCVPRCSTDAATNLARTDHAQPALFAVEYALAELAESYGIAAAAIAGHSIGEYVAATLAGVFDLSDRDHGGVRARPSDARRTARRHGGRRAGSRRRRRTPLRRNSTSPRSMTPETAWSSGAAEPRCASLRGPPRRVWRTGPPDAHLTCIPFQLDGFRAAPSSKASCRGLTLRASRHVPLLSNTTGTWMTAEEATDPRRWARQIRATVKFSGELDTVLADPHRVLVEVGPGGSLTASAARQPQWSISTAPFG